MSDNETKAFHGKLEIKSAEQGIVSAVVARFNVLDKDGDVLLSGSFPPVSYVKLSAYGHDVMVDGAAPVGKGTITVQGDEAIFNGNYFMSIPRGVDAFRTVKELGAQGEWSFGWLRRYEKTAPMTNEWRDKGARRLLSFVNPVEVSAVFIGAGEGTGTISAKSEAEDVADSLEEKFRKVKAIAREIEQRELDEIKRRVDAAAKKVADIDANTWATEFFGDLKYDSRLLDAYPTSEQTNLIYRLHKYTCAFEQIPEEKRPTVRWFYDGKRFDPRPKVGMFDSQTNTIWLWVELKGEDLARVYLHEAHHSYEHRHGYAVSEAAADHAMELGLERVRKEGLIW
jgi:hypothetical protein